MVNWKANETKRPWLILKYYSVLSCSEEKLRKPTRTASVWPKMQSQLYCFVYALRLDLRSLSLCNTSFQFSHKDELHTWIAPPPAPTHFSTRATDQVGPTATKRKLSATGQNRARTKPATSTFTNDTHNVSFLTSGWSKPMACETAASDGSPVHPLDDEHGALVTTGEKRTRTSSTTNPTLTAMELIPSLLWSEVSGKLPVAWRSPTLKP
jgi:hypothetical protein